MVISGFVGEGILARAELRFATIMHGALCVMTCGGLLTPMWPADSLDFLQLVHIYLFTICYGDNYTDTVVTV